MSKALPRQIDPHNARLMAQAKVDGYFHGQVWRYFGVDLFAGVSTPQSRQAAIKDFIEGHGLDAKLIGRTGVSWARAYERGYGVKL